MTKALTLPPPFGFAAAALVGAAGAVQVAQIAGTQFNPSGAAEGVSSFGSNARDTIMSPLNPKEIVIPTSFSEGIRKGDLSLGGPGKGGGQIILQMNINGDVIGMPKDEFYVKSSKKFNSLIQTGRIKSGAFDGATS